MSNIRIRIGVQEVYVGNQNRRATSLGQCPECSRAILLRRDGRLRRHRTFEGIYCEDEEERIPRFLLSGSIRKLTKKEAQELQEGTVKYVVRFSPR